MSQNPLTQLCVIDPAHASQMITDHQKTSNELKSMIQSGKADASVPSDLDSSHQKMLDKLKGLNGADFTKQYDKDQVSAQAKIKDEPLTFWGAARHGIRFLPAARALPGTLVGEV